MAEVLKGHGFSRANKAIKSTLGFTGCGKTTKWPKF
jgi:ABC-type sugar transport system ATPase subunit